MKSTSKMTYEDLMNEKNPLVQDAWQKLGMDFETLDQFLSLKKNKLIRLKRMFGGLAIYRGDVLCLILMEDPHLRIYKKITSEFALWNGVLIATDHSHHEKLRRLFKDLIPHPVLGKWLYLKRESRSWTSICERLGKLVLEQSPLIGVEPKPKKAKPPKRKPK